MTCSTSVEEMLSRPVRMTFIEYEAGHAICEEDCRWPPESHEYAYWMRVFQKEKPPAVTPGALIPHQRDAEMANKSAVPLSHSADMVK